MIHRDISVKEVAERLSNFMYADNLQATKELMELFDKVVGKSLNTIADYVKIYDDSFYTFQTWEELIVSEAEQTDGWTEEQCKKELNHTIWQLPCGWYVQYV